nr:hypothetical protein A4A49_24482 [Ipomoea trifida]
MAKNPSYYQTSWADQWGPEPLFEEHNKMNDRKTTKFSDKMSETFDKTKVVASTGAKKVKAGASAGFRWIKDKCHKTSQKH